MKNIFLCVLVIAGFLTGCKKDNNHACTALKQGLQDGNFEIVKEEINILSAGLLPHSTAADPDAQKENIDDLVNRINDRCGLKAVVICYGCIYTLPAQSEIQISFNSGNGSIRKILDITVSSQNRLQCVNVHD